MVCNRTGLVRLAHLGMVCLSIVKAYWIRSLSITFGWRHHGKSKVFAQYVPGSFV